MRGNIVKFESAIKSKKIAIIVSYLMILVNTLSNLLLTPLCLKYLGIEMYGLYQMVYSVAHYILILDFGICTTMVRYIATYHAKDDYNSEKNFSAHCLGIVAVIIAVVAIIGVIVNSQLLKIYPSIAQNEAGIAHNIFVIMVVTIAITILEHFFQGIIMAYEHFSIVKLISLLKIILKICLTVVMLILGLDVVSIVLADLIVSVLSVLLMAVYSFGIIKFKIKLSHLDKALIFSVSSFMFAIFLQSVVSYVNNVVDKTILGVMTTKTDVAIYSVGLTFITLFNSMSSVISGVFLPQATKLVSHDADRKTLTEFISRPGRYQFILCGAIIAGFILFGKEFIVLWAGSSTIRTWDIALIIMIPNMIPLIENTVISILDAKKKRLFRSIVLFGISVINVIISIVLVKQYGMIGAPIGTAISFIVGYGVIMNIYYQKKIGINVISMFKTIFSRTWLCILAASVASAPLNLVFKAYSLKTFAFKAFVFSVVYAITLCIFGLNKTEKNDLSAFVRKIKKV